MNREKIYSGLSLLFAIITLIGAGIVLFNKGTISPGMAVISCCCCTIFSSLSLREKNKKKIEDSEKQSNEDK